jgi:two-component system sensor histidine kinase MprB
MKLRTRIAVIASAAVAVAVLLASIGAYFAARNELIDQVDASLVALANEAQDLRGFASILGPFNRGPLRSPDDFEVIYIQAFGPTLRPERPRNQEVALPIDVVDQAVVDRTRGFVIRTVEVEDRSFRMITAPLTGSEFVEGATIQIARSQGEVDRTLQGLTALLAFVGAAGVGFAGLLGLAVARSALRPISKLTDAAEHVAETQELAARIEVEREDEVGRLAASFNAMLAALEESRAQQHRLVRDASHELRTPLTALRTNIEVLNRNANLDPDQRAELLDDVTFELEQLGDLVTELVDLATDARTSTEPLAEVELDEVVRRAVDRFSRRTGRSVSVDAEPTSIVGRASMLERAVSNLLENAHKWSPDDGAVEVRLAGGRLSVRDHGPGIADEDRPHVFDRFYRSVDARTKPGSGLGLSIVKQVAEDHGGDVFAEAAADGGALVGFALPAGLDVGTSQGALR